MRKSSVKLDVTLCKKSGQKLTLCVFKPFCRKDEIDINSIFSFSVQLYSLEQSINVSLQTKNIPEKNLRNLLPLTLKKNYVMRTGGIGKQTFFVKNYTVKNTCEHMS